MFESCRWNVHLKFCSMRATPGWWVLVGLVCVCQKCCYMIVAICMVLQRKDSACWVIFARTTMAWTLWWWKILAFRMSSPSLLLLQVTSTWCLPKSKAFSLGKAQQAWLGWNSKRNPFPWLLSVHVLPLSHFSVSYRLDTRCKAFTVLLTINV